MQCNQEGCERPHYAKGACRYHYDKDRRPLRKRRKRGVCSVEGCGRSHSARGLCDNHYHKVHLKGPQYYRRVIRARAIAALGGKCVCCGETEFAFLVIDHIEGGGTKRRGADAYAENRRTLNDPGGSGCQVLCANCNMAKERTEGCPHWILRPTIGA